MPWVLSKQMYIYQLAELRKVKFSMAYVGGEVGCFGYAVQQR